MASDTSVPGIPQAPAPQTSVPPVAAPHPVAVGTSANVSSLGSEASRQPSTRQPFTWVGSPWALAGTCVWNAVLSILTLGIYSFWGRTEIRKRLWSSVRLYDEPLAYHGTPRELMRGFFAVLLAVLLPLFLAGIFVSAYFGQATAGAYQLGLIGVLYPILTAIAFYRGRRYRLSRTSWRGIRASLTGSAGGYAAFSWLTMCAIPLTLFWIMPYRAVELQRAIVSDTTLGNARLRFEGTSAPVYKRYALLWFGTLLLVFGTLVGVAWLLGGRAQPSNPFWWASIRARDIASIIALCIGAVVLWSLTSSFYYARLYNYLAHATVITPDRPGVEPARFALDVTGKRIIWLFVTNMLITYLSLYVLKPVAMARAMKYYADNLAIVGPFDPASIGQNTSLFDPAGEGLAQAFDLDAF